MALECRMQKKRCPCFDGCEKLFDTEYLCSVCGDRGAIPVYRYCFEYLCKQCYKEVFEIG